MDTFLNWLWQGAGVALAAGVILRVSGVLGATARCCVWWTALLLIVLLPLSSIPADSAAVGRLGDPILDDLSVPVIPIPDLSQAAGIAGVWLWTLWAAVLGCRAGVDVLRVRRLKRECRPFPAGCELRLAHWAAVRAQGRRTRLALSDAVASAAVLGGPSPVIAVAPSLLANFDDGDLDRIVLHEWAHVQRCDDITNFVQVLIRIAAGWHPAIWWVERKLCLEREAACDERAVRLTGSARAYARCLTRLAAMRREGSRLVLAPGALSSSSLAERVLRLVRHTPRISARRSAMTAAAAVVCLAIVARALSGLPLVVTTGTSELDGTSVSAASASFTATADESGREARLAPEGPDSSPRSRRTMHRPGARRPPAHRSLIDLAASSRLESDSPMETGPGPETIPVASRASLPTSLPVALIPLVELSTVPGATSVSATGGNPSLEERSEGHRSAGLPPRVSAPWEAASDAGVALARGSRNAAVATAGFFTRFGKRIAGRF